MIFIIAVVGIAVAFSAALKPDDSNGAPTLSDLRGESEITVRTMQPAQIRYSPQVRVNGTVQASAEVLVSPQVSGEIRRVSSKFRAGSDVKRGDLLFEIERADYVLAVERAESEIAAASSDLAQLEAEARLAVIEWEELYPGREVNELAARIPQIEAAKARLASAIANKKTSELSLQRTRVYAPLDARVLSSTLDVGQIVSPGQTVGRLVTLESIELAVPVSLDQLAVIEPAIGRDVSFKRRGTVEAERNGTVMRIDASLDERTRLSNLYVSPASSERLRIGDFVDVIIASDPVDRAYVIPATALTGQSRVWVVEDGRLASREVTTLGERSEGAEIITQAFDTGAGVVITPPLEAEDGQEVTARGGSAVATSASGVTNGAR
ncbi:MAG: efflux RND transporter periplasmic adaptor subunit [Henriciella sp.]|nr:efflux RND transporter periplasmic adaptor subunit [Henriciella sp.]